MENKYDIIIIGSGPGGYVAAIRASQLGKKVAVIEKENLGGICLNWGCIPTKALLKSAQVYEYMKHAADYGIHAGNISPDFKEIVKRSRAVADKMSKGVQYLMKKNKIEVIKGTGRLASQNTVLVEHEGKSTEYSADHIILATGARSRELPHIPIDGKKVIGYRQALALTELPESMVVIGSGAIGSELAYFYHTMGTQVTLVEIFPHIVPLEDEEVSKQLARSFKKAGIKIMTDSTVEKVNTNADKCEVFIKSNKDKELKVEADVVLSAVGIQANIENLGLEELNIKTEKGKVIVNEYYETNVKGIYAIGDIVPGPALAHVASAEGIICVEKISGLTPQPLDYNNIPACTYTSPEVASVGYTEKAAIEAGYEIKVGKFPFTASGKASAAGHNEGFVKLIFDAKYGEILGAHMIGAGVTELIAEIVTARKLESTAFELIKAVHPHPTMSEAIMEAAANAYDESIHI